MINKPHITNNEFSAFMQDTMNSKDRETFLEHICTCGYCSELFATLMSEDIIAAPRDMKANILDAVKQPGVLFEVRVRETSKRIQLLLYSLKVGTATAVALLLLVFSINLTGLSTFTSLPKGFAADDTHRNKNHVSLTATIRDSMDEITDSMLDFSNNIMNTEVINND